MVGVDYKIFAYKTSSKTSDKHPKRPANIRNAH